ncbi:microtubule associated protein SPM2 [Toxoplasma gondii TgCatPRC2]|uniref:Microtubule associated protein SPM2 n=2 Tax=Toxoplasma gondii TaxID=5811 RepID=A0A151HHU4_TOXGO|nr:microtubule associated protein SPM2 [Toxoplasma gondii ME49]EPT31009.1 microtubule associated protein SPM2 [Toxoplasma gondii ME49]KYK68874.1 microtubule associated protein SPM2 [Toxoplasma gondii TgCatPRC2]|eukprot:XP_018637778.1 microtubule associated protein SPM2 [Toxoplasma gondii ME49]
MALPLDAWATAAHGSKAYVARSADVSRGACFSPAGVTRVSHQGIEPARPAGVSSRRLTQLRLAMSQQPEDRAHAPRGPTAYSCTALRDNVNEILRSATIPRDTDPVAAVLDRKRVDDYAGMRSDGINELRTPSHRWSAEVGKKRGLMTKNESVFVSDVLEHHGRPIDDSPEFQHPRVAAYLQQQCKPKCRSLQRHYGPDELHKAFYTKFEVVDKTTGRTEIMTARRPGSAAAIISLCNFDAYSTRSHKATSAQKQVSNIESTPLGLVPRKGAELPHKPSFTQTAASVCMKRSQLRCQDSWLTPSSDAPTIRHLGQSRRHVALPWLHRPTNRILQHLPQPRVQSRLVCQVDHAKKSPL